MSEHESEVELLRRRYDHALAMTEHDQGVICELLEHRGKLKIALLNIMNAGNANPESIRKIIADAIKATDCKEYDEHGGVLGFIDVNHASTL